MGKYTRELDQAVGITKNSIAVVSEETSDISYKTTIDNMVQSMGDVTVTGGLVCDEFVTRTPTAVSKKSWSANKTQVVNEIYDTGYINTPKSPAFQAYLFADQPINTGFQKIEFISVTSRTTTGGTGFDDVNHVFAVPFEAVDDPGPAFYYVCFHMNISCTGHDNPWELESNIYSGSGPTTNEELKFRSTESAHYREPYRTNLSLGGVISLDPKGISTDRYLSVHCKSIGNFAGYAERGWLTTFSGFRIG